MVRSLIPLTRRGDDTFFSLRQEMNRLFDDALRGLPALDRKSTRLNSSH